MVEVGALQLLRLVPYSGSGWYLTNTLVEAGTLTIQWLMLVPDGG